MDGDVDVCAEQKVVARRVDTVNLGASGTKQLG